MKAVIQRVLEAEVEVESRVVGKIAQGLLVYVGVADGDDTDAAAGLAFKIAHLRIFQDEQGKLNKSVQDVRGGILAIPNFTLLADASKGRRPALLGAADAASADRVFSQFVSALSAFGFPVAQGVFGANMAIRSQADGPVNILLDWPPARLAERSQDPSSEDAANNP